MKSYFIGMLFSAFLLTAQQNGARIVVTYEGRTSASFPVQVTQYAPGVFTLDLTGKGQAVAVNQDGTINTGSAPARVGDVISLYATGLDEGDVTVRIDSQSALLTPIKKTGGVVQIGVRRPGGIHTGSVVPVVLQVGNTSSQPGVTIAVLPPNLTQSPGTFAETGHMITPRFLHTATLLWDGRVLIVGGDSSYSTANAESSAELYDPAAGTFVSTGSLTTPRDSHTATLLPNGKVLIAGGGPRINGVGYSLASAELYDPANGTFSATGSMTLERSFHTATLLNNGKVLIAGGIRRVFGGSPLDVTFPTSAELYDPATGAFTPSGDMNGPFADTATLLANGKVLITRGNPQGPGPYLSSAELYDPSTGRFTSAGYLNVNHSGPSATLLMNGSVLIAGGDIGDGDGASIIAELYDPATGKFTTTGPLTTGREQNATTLLPDGTVLFTGGHGGVPVPGGGYDNLASAEIYDALSGAFSAAGAMLTGRDILGATLLNNGQVLITGGNKYYPFGAGGRDPQHPVVSMAELYTPAILVPAPALFSLGGDGRGQGAIWHDTTGEIVSLSSPAVAGEVLSMYTTSLADRGAIPPQVAIGGRLAAVLYYGAAPGYPGYYQVNFRVPNGVAPGPAAPVRLTYLGRPSNAVTMSVQ